MSAERPSTQRLGLPALWRDPERGFPLRAALVTLAGALLLGAPMLLHGRVLSGGDIVNQYLPYKHLIRSILSRGQFPHWDPLIFGGRPLQGDIQTGLFYPLNVFYWVLPLPVAFTLVALLHYWIAGWGMALWARRWMRGEAGPLLAGVLYMLAGRFTVVQMDGVVLLAEAAAWLPWLLWAWHRLTQSLDEDLERTPWDFAAVVALLALTALAGAPQIAFYCGLALAVYALVLAWGAAPGTADDNAARSAAGEATERPLLPLRLKPLLLLAAAGGLAAALCAVQLLPTQLLIGQSWDRAHGASWNYVTDGSLEPRMLLTAVAPQFFGHPRDEFVYWGESGYHEVSNYFTAAGPFLALLLGLLAFVRRRGRLGAARAFGADSLARRHAGFLVAVLVAAVLLAPGKHSPVFWFAYHLVPGFDRFRVPARMMLWAALAVAGLAGRALDVLLAEPRERYGNAAGSDRRTALNCIAGVTVAGLAAVGILWAAAPQLAVSLGMEHLRPRAGQSTAEWTHQIEALQATARDEVLEFALQWAIVGALAAAIVLTSSSEPVTPERERPARTEDGDPLDDGRAGRSRSGVGRSGDGHARSRCSVPWRSALSACLIAGCAARLAWHGWAFTTAAPNAAFMEREYPQTERVALLERELAQGGRFLWLDSVLDWRYDQNQPELLTDRPIVDGLRQMRGYDPVNSRRFGLLMNAIAGLPADTNPLGQMHVPDTDMKSGQLSLAEIRWPLVHAWDCRVVLTYAPAGESADMEEIARWTFPPDSGTGPQILRALRFRDSWGPARLCRPIVARADMTLERLSAWMGQPEFDIHAMALVEGENPLAALDATPWQSQAAPPGEEASANPAAAGAGTEPSGGPVRVVRAEAGRWEFDVQAAQAALLVVADGYYPGWRARVDGVTVPVVPANVAQCGVPVPPGHHRVEMFFRPREFVQGALVSGFTLLLTALVVLRWRRKLRMG